MVLSRFNVGKLMLGGISSGPFGHTSPMHPPRKEQRSCNSVPDTAALDFFCLQPHFHVSVTALRDTV